MKMLVSSEIRYTGIYNGLLPTKENYYGMCGIKERSKTMVSNKQWLTDVNLAFTNGYNKALEDLVEEGNLLFKGLKVILYADLEK